MHACFSLTSLSSILNQGPHFILCFFQKVNWDLSFLHHMITKTKDNFLLWSSDNWLLVKNCCLTWLIITCTLKFLNILPLGFFFLPLISWIEGLSKTVCCWCTKFYWLFVMDKDCQQLICNRNKKLYILLEKAS